MKENINDEWNSKNNFYFSSQNVKKNVCSVIVIHKGKKEEIKNGTYEVFRLTNLTQPWHSLLDSIYFVWSFSLLDYAGPQIDCSSWFKCRIIGCEM